MEFTDLKKFPPFLFNCSGGSWTIDFVTSMCLEFSHHVVGTRVGTLSLRRRLLLALLLITPSFDRAMGIICFVIAGVSFDVVKL